MALHDPVAAFREMLLRKERIIAVTDRRIYGSPSTLRVPKGYTPGEQGPCIAFVVSPTRQDYSSIIHEHSIEVRCYATTEAQADILGRLVYEEMNDRRWPPILVARQAEGLQVMQEPDTGWFFSMATWDIQVRQEPATQLIVR